MFEQPTLRNIAITRPTSKPAEWLDGVRESIAEPGKYLAMFADGRTHVIELSDGWSRIGRSRSADIRLDDPTVSRRHAVVVQTPEGDLRVLDDRSMNGICVNGEPVDWSPLADGDELQIGRYTLSVIESAGLAGPNCTESVGYRGVDRHRVLPSIPRRAPHRRTSVGVTTSLSCWRRFRIRAAASKIRLIPELSM